MTTKNEFYFAYFNFRKRLKIFETSSLRGFLKLASGVISEMQDVSNKYTPFHNYKHSCKEDIHIIIDIENPLLFNLMCEIPSPTFIIKKLVIIDLPNKNDIIITDTKLDMDEYFEFRLTPFNNWCIINTNNVNFAR